MKSVLRYSEAFQIKILEEMRDGKWKSTNEAAIAYGVSVGSISYWMHKHGFDYLKGRVVYVKTKSEIDEIKRLKAEIKKLKEALADVTVDRLIDDAVIKLMAEQLHTTPEEFKKKVAEQ